MVQSVCLVAMPWQAVESPSLPIGLLRTACRREGLAVPETYHGGVRWAEFLLAATDGALGPAEYLDIAENGLFHGLGDWIFSGVLYGTDFGTERLSRYAERHGLDLAVAHAMRPFAEEFVDRAVDEILERSPDVVGFTTTFMQNMPSLAAARLLKQRAPEVTVVFGGGNCDGDMGAALHRNFPFVDFVVRGEGEAAFPALLRALDGEGDLPSIAGLCWRDGTGQRLNRMGPLLPPERIPVPDFDDWFAVLAASPVAEYVEPKLVVETARGCWWGERHHCTFCGLNGTGMTFRSKSPQAAFAELSELIRRHEVLDVIVVDNIIDNAYFTSLLPALAAQDWDLRIHYEVKSNLRPTEIAALRDAHVRHVQPGVESLASPVLRLMDKGVSGTRNVRVLRDFESAGMTVSWNWLYGFPGEHAGHYEQIIPRLRDLVHLQPPSSVARILLERFSPYFADPRLGFGRRAPAEAYRHVYALPEEELADLVYLFDTEHCGLGEDEAEALFAEIAWWRDHYTESALVRHDRNGAIVLEDARAGRPRSRHEIDEPALVAAYAELEHGRSLPALARRLSEQGHVVSDRRLSDWVRQLVDAGLAFAEGGQVLALATTATPIKMAA